MQPLFFCSYNACRTTTGGKIASHEARLPYVSRHAGICFGSKIEFFQCATSFAPSADKNILQSRNSFLQA